MGAAGAWQQMQPQAFFANRERLYRGMDSSWYRALWEKDAFSQRVKQLYREEFRPLLERYLQENLYAYANQISAAARRNQLRWNRSPAWEEAEQIEGYMHRRMEFLDSVWLEGETWYRILVDINDGSNIACYAVRPGDPLPQLPDISGIYDALGWYHRESEEPVDENLPVTSDLDIYCKRQVWEEPDAAEPGKSLSKVPSAALLMLFLAAAAWEWMRLSAGTRKGTGTDKHQN